MWSAERESENEWETRTEKRQQRQQVKAERVMRGIREWRRKRSEWLRVQGHLWAYRIILSLIEADVSVEDLDEELNLQGGVHALVSDLQSLLQAFHHPPPITDLTTEGKKIFQFWLWWTASNYSILSWQKPLSPAPLCSEWSYELEWDALLLGATHTSQEHAVELREGTQHDRIFPHAFMSHNDIDYRSLLKENKHNCHIRSPVFRAISRACISEVLYKRCF